MNKLLRKRFVHSTQKSLLYIKEFNINDFNTKMNKFVHFAWEAPWTTHKKKF